MLSTDATRCTPGVAANNERAAWCPGGRQSKLSTTRDRGRSRSESARRAAANAATSASVECPTRSTSGCNCSRAARRQSVSDRRASKAWMRTTAAPHGSNTSSMKMSNSRFFDPTPFTKTEKPSCNWRSHACVAAFSSGVRLAACSPSGSPAAAARMSVFGKGLALKGTEKKSFAKSFDSLPRAVASSSLSSPPRTPAMPAPSLR
mmetsp:Transcript_26922/g.78068  ORF Transcript_26922/g.78068 Transcript_26922/m.78068 type:complete len:205 (+) Transcript_26922:755-1369(+)